MESEARFTHLELAKSLNKEVWSLLGKSDRTADEQVRMIHAAHASCLHWMHAGTGLHLQRGEWLIAKVYATLGHAEAVMRHARRCAALTEAHGSEMKDFDRAYALEIMARAYALAGDVTQATELKAQARAAGQSIADDEDRKIFVDDLDAPDWHGVP